MGIQVLVKLEALGAGLQTCGPPHAWLPLCFVRSRTALVALLVDWKRSQSLQRLYLCPDTIPPLWNLGGGTALRFHILAELRNHPELLLPLRSLGPDLVGVGS